MGCNFIISLDTGLVRLLRLVSRGRDTRDGVWGPGVGVGHLSPKHVPFRLPASRGAVERAGRRRYDYHHKHVVDHTLEHR